MRNKSGIKQVIAAREQGRRDGIKFAAMNYSGAVLLCLKDKFDFTTEQLIEAKAHINDIFDSVCSGYLTLGDITDVLKEENDIDLIFTKNNPQIKPDHKLETIQIKAPGEDISVDKEAFINKYLNIRVDDSDSLLTDEGEKIIKDKIAKHIANELNRGVRLR